MNTLTEIEAAAEALPPEQKEELMRFLARRVRAQATLRSESRPLARSKRGFPISEGRVPFNAEDVRQIEAEAELSR